MSVQTMHANFVAAEHQAVDFDPDYNGAPLNQTITFRLSKPMAAQITIRSLVERTDTSKIIRRWLRAGAKAEGFEIDSVI